MRRNNAIGEVGVARRRPFRRAVVVLAGLLLGLPVIAPPAQAVDVPSTFAPLSPARLWDSRFGPGPMGGVGADQSRDITFAGFGGVPAAGATSVVVNVTAVGATADTFVTVWPTGEPRPLASNLNVPAGDTRPNLVTVKLGAGGQVSFYNSAGTVDLIADVSGWYGPTGGRRFTPLTPFRRWDSRVGPGPVGRLPAGLIAGVQLVGGQVPAEGTSGLVLNVTAVNPTADTHITVWPGPEAKPLASNLNIPAGDTRPNLVIVKSIDGGHGTEGNGVINFTSSAGLVDLVVDIAGYFHSTGNTFTSVSPSRVWDSRSAPGPAGAVGPGESRDITVTGIGGVPLSGVVGVVLNVTAVGPSAETYVTAWPTGEAQPLASNLNVPPGDTRPNLAIVKVGTGGKVSFFNAAGTVHLVVDLAGWFGPGVT
jgi:hypothetical protein